MSAAYITREGAVVQLDGRAGSQLVITAADVSDAEKLARLLQDALRDVAELKRRWKPRVRYFRDIALDATSSKQFPLEHGFNGRVNFEVAHWVPALVGFAPQIEPDATPGAQTANRLVLISSVQGTATIRVEEAG